MQIICPNMDLRLYDEESGTVRSLTAEKKVTKKCLCKINYIIIVKYK